MDFLLIWFFGAVCGALGIYLALWFDITFDKIEDWLRSFRK